MKAIIVLFLLAQVVGVSVRIAPSVEVAHGDIRANVPVVVQVEDHRITYIVP